MLETGEPLKDRRRSGRKKSKVKKASGVLVV